MAKKKLLLISIPRLNAKPQAGLRYLKDFLFQIVDVEIYDANLDLHKELIHTDHWPAIEKWGIAQQRKKDTPIELWKIIQARFDHWTMQIKSHHPDYIGISVFTHESRNWAQWLCYNIRTQLPDVPILLGGKGLCDPGLGQAVFGQYCKTFDLCDHYFNGESENEMMKYFQEMHCIIDNFDHPVINNNIDFEKFSTHDNSEYFIENNWYSDHDRDGHENSIQSTDIDYYTTFSTRGCVKKCTFCDVHLVRPKFSMRSAQNLFEELKYAIDRGHRYVCFSDDMINGSNKQFMSWMESLALYLESKQINGFTWSGQMGIKSKRSIPAEMFELMRRTGARPTIGVDHFSDSVLDHMGKHYNRDDIFDFFEKGKKNDVVYGLLMFVIAYPTEQTKDFETLVENLVKMVPYSHQVGLWDFGTTCNIVKGSVLESLPGMVLQKNQTSWDWPGNRDLDTEQKRYRRQKIEKLAAELGFNVRRQRTQKIRLDAWTK